MVASYPIALAALFLAGGLSARIASKNHQKIESLALVDLSDGVNQSVSSGSVWAPFPTNGYTFNFSIRVKFDHFNENYPRIMGPTDSFVFYGCGPAYGANRGKVGFYMHTVKGVGAHGRGGGDVFTKTKLSPGQWYTLIVEKTSDELSIDVVGYGRSVATRTVPRVDFQMKPILEVDLASKSSNVQTSLFEVSNPSVPMWVPFSTEGYYYKFSIDVKFENFNENYPLIMGPTDSFVFHGCGPAYGANRGKVGFYIHTVKGVGAHGRGGGDAKTKTKLSPGRWYTLIVEKTSDELSIEVVGDGRSVATRTVPRVDFQMKPILEVDLASKSSSVQTGAFTVMSR